MPIKKGKSGKKLTIKKKLEEVQNDKIYCRKCESNKSTANFYEATNPMIDSNGYMSVCKDCCNDLYKLYFSIHNNLEIALQLTCQDLDVRFSGEAIRQTQSHVEKMISKGQSADKVFGYYKSKLSSTSKKNEGIDSFRFKDSDILTYENIENIEEQEVDEELQLFWGKGFSFDDYAFLEVELSNWKQTHKCDNHAELTLLKEICIKILEIRKRRENDKDTGNLQKELQELMKTASVDPAKANIASAGKLNDAWGLWIKDIEQYRPAEWHDKQEKYKDMDGFIDYIKNYIVRPIKNFITGNRDFKINDNINVNLNEEVILDG